MRTEVFVRSGLLNYDSAVVSEETGLKCEDPSRAVQSQKDEADINNIVKRYGVTGTVPQGGRLPVYGDFSGIADYQEAMQAIQLASESFLALPSGIRARFDHNPMVFADYVSDPANIEEVRKLGLAPEAAAPPSTPIS